MFNNLVIFYKHYILPFGISVTLSFLDSLATMGTCRYNYEGIGGGTK